MINSVVLMVEKLDRWRLKKCCLASIQSSVVQHWWAYTHCILRFLFLADWDSFLHTMVVKSDYLSYCRLLVNLSQSGHSLLTSVRTTGLHIFDVEHKRDSTLHHSFTLPPSLPRSVSPFRFSERSDTCCDGGIKALLSRRGLFCTVLIFHSTVLANIH